MAEPKQESLLNYENLGRILQNMQPYHELMMYYDCAMREVTTKVEVLNREFATRYSRNPVESIQTRLKQPASIAEKLERVGAEPNIANVQKYIHDVAGVRIVCSFIEDIYAIAGFLTSQDDITLLKTKDYIKHPKSNGYRSLHLLEGIPIFLSTGKRSVCVEVQIRTTAMDFWASIDHKIRYKKDIPNRVAVTARMREVADQIAALDREMQDINHEITGKVLLEGDTAERVSGVSMIPWDVEAAMAVAEIDTAVISPEE